MIVLMKMVTLAEYVVGTVMCLLALASLIGVFACLYYSGVMIFGAWQEIRHKQFQEAALIVVASALLVFAALVCFVFTGYAITWGMEAMP